jgi:hypothetical protein
VLGGVVATVASAKGGLSRSTLGSSSAVKVVIPLPSPGDVSYGFGELRVTGGSAGVPGAGTGAIFAAHVGQLGIAASSSAWSKVRKNTHVYVVSVPANRSGSVRLVGFFVVRHSGGSSAGGSVTFNVAGGQALTSGYFGKGVTRAGRLNLFVVRNALSTAVTNWGRSLTALNIAHALKAAMHPLIEGWSPSDAVAASSADSPSGASTARARDRRPACGRTHEADVLVPAQRDAQQLGVCRREAQHARDAVHHDGAW